MKKRLYIIKNNSTFGAADGWGGGFSHGHIRRRRLYRSEGQFSRWVDKGVLHLQQVLSTHWEFDGDCLVCLHSPCLARHALGVLPPPSELLIGVLNQAVVLACMSTIRVFKYCVCVRKLVT